MHYETLLKEFLKINETFDLMKGTLNEEMENKFKAFNKTYHEVNFFEMNFFDE
jgi:hypothetical protein